jgi:hypothetical protein
MAQQHAEGRMGCFCRLLEANGEAPVTCTKLETVEEVLQTADVRVPSLPCLPSSLPPTILTCFPLPCTCTCHHCLSGPSPACTP